MAQSNNGDIFDFVIEPVFDTGKIDDYTKDIGKQLKEAAERIANEIQDKMGKAFTFPSNFDKTDINQVMKLVSQLGGEFTRTGTQINATFKDADGNIVKVTSSIDGAISKLKQLREMDANSNDAAVANYAKKQLGYINQYENTSMTYTGSDQIKSQAEIESNIISLVKEEYQYQQKIFDAQRDNNKLKEDYYTNLQNIATQQRQNYESQYQGDTQNIENIKKETLQRESLYETMTLRQKAQSDASQTEQKNIQTATTLMKQYYTTRSNMDKMEANGQSGGNYWNEQKQEIDSVTQELEKFGITVDQTTGKLNFDSQSTNAQKLGQNLDKVNTTLEQGNTALDQRRAKMADQAPITAIQEYGKQLKVVNELESNKKTGTQAYKDSKAALDALEQELAKYGITIKTATDGTKSMEAAQGTQATQTEACTQAMQEFNAQQQNSKTESDNFGKSIQESVANFIKYQVALEALNKLVSEFTSAIKDMDDAMTQVRMVTMGSYEDTVKLSQQYGELAQKLGTTVTTVAEGADAWLRQGYSAKDAMTMLEASTTLATVGQMDAAEATDQLTAITKSYNTSVEDTMGIVDKLVSVDLEYAASSSEISTALQKVASSAGQAGLGLDKLIGLITVSEEKTRQSAEVIGSAWQSIVSRISKIPANVDLDDLTDETGKVVATVNDADKVLTKYGIALVGTDGKMRDLGTIMDEIGAKWSQMSQLEQNQLAYVVLSSHNTEKFVGVVMNTIMFLYR